MKVQLKIYNNTLPDRYVGGEFALLQELFVANISKCDD